MDSAKLLKDLRDGLWQAAIELERPPGEPVTDPYNVPHDELIEDLVEHGVLIGDEPATVLGFLASFGQDEDSTNEVPDNIATEISRITAELRSNRATGDRDLSGFGDQLS